MRAKWLERILFKKLKNSGLNIISSVDAPKKISQSIKNKEIVAFAMDQHVQIENRSGVAVEFFGVKAGTYRSLAFLFISIKLQLSQEHAIENKMANIL